LAAGQLFVSLDKSTPALYLTAIPARRASAKSRASLFPSLLSKHVGGANLVSIWKDPMDRIVDIEFHRLAEAGLDVKTTLRLALTGSSANAYLIDVNGGLIASLFEQPTARVGAPPSSSSQLDRKSLTDGLEKSTTQSELLKRFFGACSIFSPQLKDEFLARCEDLAPVDSFKSLAEDLFDRAPTPLLYSRIPLERIGQEVINPKSDLLLSHIELVQAHGMLRYEFDSLSEAAQEYYAARSRAVALRGEYSQLRQKLAREVKRREAVIDAIESDHARFESPDRLKRRGDLILANLANARIDRSKVRVIDYYDANQAEIEIDIPEGATLKEAAADYFARYQKAQRALKAIASRRREISRELDPLRGLLQRLDERPTADCIAEVQKAAEQLLGTATIGHRVVDKRKKERANAVGRKFKSSDGYEIVIGRNDRENDALTFRVARPNDVWLHAADYPGSHVIIRNPARGAMPHRTITEAAELAAFYSQAKHEGKAAVHYTQKKYVSKPPRSRPGLVRLSSFKTILVQPHNKLKKME
jgi:predicted ribosome quality control (RQC) complex YloA/Tae2 family protein